MTRGDFETFYPFQAGIGRGFPANFESGYFMPTSLGGAFVQESSFEDDPELNDQNDDQENTEYENEAAEVGAMEQTQQLPCFRQAVRAKKAELKAQFGKGHISIGECGVMPFRLMTPKYNPIVRIGESKVCVGWGSPSCDKKCLGVCCGSRPCTNWKTLVQGNTAAYDAATARFNADKAAWDQCRAENKGIWVPGWRREWRKFKKAGGLNELKQQSTRCIFGNPTGGGNPILPGGTPTYTPTYVPEGGGTPPLQQQPEPADMSVMTCKDFASQYGIIPGKTFGTAPDGVRGEWVRRGCNAISVSTGIDPGGKATAYRPGAAPEEEATADGGKNTKMIIYAAIAVVVIITIALIVRAMRSKK